jgi:hypothetical protein
MTAGASGPPHVFNSEQIWTVLDGELSVAIAGQREDFRCGDTVVLSADLERQIFAGQTFVCLCAVTEALSPGCPESPSREGHQPGSPDREPLSCVLPAPIGRSREVVPQHPGTGLAHRGTR